MSANGLAVEAVTQLQNARQKIQPPPAENAAAIDNALSALAVYIPAEAMALYLALSSSLPVIQRDFPVFDRTSVYWFFVFIFSPGLFLLAFFVKLAKDDASMPAVREFPWFRLMSSILAFGVWGLCVPGNPFEDLQHPGRGVLFGILATIVSIVLPSLEAIYNWIERVRKRNSEIKKLSGTDLEEERKKLTGLPGNDGNASVVPTEAARQ